MRVERDDVERDPELDRLLQEERGAGPPAAREIDRLFHGVEARVQMGNVGPSGFLRTRPTLVRRVLALLAFAVVVGLTTLAMPPSDWAALMTLRSIAAFGAFGVLLSICIAVALRPLHAPALGVWQGILLAKATVVATFVLALVPVTAAAHAPAGMSLFQDASPCCVLGLLFGLPVYAVTRMLDRGTFLGPLLAASAAGLAGNIFLQIHCPTSDAAHNVAGHASVAVVFVLGVAALEVLTRRR
jgi:hypothetical protein